MLHNEQQDFVQTVVVCLRIRALTMETSFRIREPVKLMLAAGEENNWSHDMYFS